jgi:tripartite-type tricarboxylate transporter receptor subunit TctC
VIVKNMGGGGGLLAVNYLGEVARPDGRIMGFFTWNVLAGMLGDPGLRVAYSKFAFIAGVENPIVLYMRRDTPPGIKKPADLMKTSGFKAVSLSPRNTNTIQQALALDLLGVKYTPVPGYKGLKRVEEAILKNEGQLANSSLPGWKGSIKPTMGELVIPIFQYVARGADGKFHRARALPDIPTFAEFYQEVKGEMPSGPRWEALETMINTFTSMFRTTFMPPGAPKEAVAGMRKAFLSLWKDEAFLADYERRVKNRPALVVGEAGENKIAALANVKPGIANVLREYIADLSK